ncbi:rCG42890 [Rattus norvegicus]|uniref:RCG42890 n=1 Tax=Rattus norvegicus TaxID=10116 RepID=A6JZQ1_RAT|nr:rCG42890 [Rattus norvegicus]
MKVYPNLLTEHFIILNVWVFHLRTIGTQCSQRPEEGIRSPETGVTACELPCGCWKSHPCPLEVRQIFLIISLTPTPSL